MDQEWLQREFRRFDLSLPIERAWMPPSSWYTHPDFYQLEITHALGRSWQPVARRSQLAEPGSYVSGCLWGWPWVIARDGEGELRAFHNVCRHKGREVVTGAGRAEALVCGYHAWSYGLDGRLQKAPQIGGIQDFDRSAMSLTPLAVEAWGPWLWLHFGPDPAPLRPTLGALDRALIRTRWGDLQYHSSTEWVIQCNWKVYVDNYLDGGYHIPHMHPTLDAQLDMSSYRTEVFEGFSIQSSAATSEADDQRLDYDPSARIGDGALYAWLYPNFMLNRYGPCLDSNYVLPLGPDRCKVVYEFYFQPSDGEEALRFIEESIEQSAITQREDIEICESVQVGLGSPAYDRGRYAPKLEIGEYHFHHLLAADLERALKAKA